MELGETFFVDARMFQLEEWEGLLRGCSYMEMNTNSCREFIISKVSIKWDKKYHKLHRSPPWTQQIRKTRTVNESLLLLILAYLVINGAPI